MVVSACDARTNQDVDDVDDDTAPSSLSRRVEGEASLLQGLPPVIAALVAEQECVGNVVSLEMDLLRAMTTSLTETTRQTKAANRSQELQDEP